ncbi:polyphenol oxidase family protein [Candidatus Saccharibacteria bacterium]|nr:polyphenol oxidase family protein [Candidatus Saccharibacteria bacterium]
MNKQILFNGVEIGISTRADGDMRFFDDGDEQRIIDNQGRLGELVGLPKARVARIRTVYDGRDSYNEYFEVTEEDLQNYCIDQPEKDIKVSDGLATKCSNLGILLPLADCLGAVFYDEEQKIIGLLHAGRHNIEQNGPENYVKFLEEHFGSDVSKLKVYFSPCARNYPIFTADNRKLIDVALEQLLNNGILEENIVDSGVDVVADRSYPSCSRGDKTERFAVVVKQN